MEIDEAARKIRALEAKVAELEVKMEKCGRAIEIVSNKEINIEEIAARLADYSRRHG